LEWNGIEYAVVKIRITPYLRAKLETNNKNGGLLSLVAVGMYTKFDAVKADKLENILVLNMTTCALVFVLPAFQGKLLSPSFKAQNFILRSVT
jgi:hypothetical protein